MYTPPSERLSASCDQVHTAVSSGQSMGIYLASEFVKNHPMTEQQPLLLPKETVGGAHRNGHHEHGMPSNDPQVLTGDSQLDAAAAYLQSLCSISSEEIRSNATARERALGISRKLSAALSDPHDTCAELAASPLKTAFVRIAIDLNLFSLLTESGRPCSSRELAIRSSSDESFVRRVLRLLDGIGFIEETGLDMWQSNAVSEALSAEAIAAGFRYRWDTITRGAVLAPNYFRTQGYRCPIDPKDGILQSASGLKETVFDQLARNPDQLHDFNLWMGHTMGNRKDWVDWFPVQSRLLTDLNVERPLLVDVGGGKGHDLQAFRRKFPDIRGRLILQDLGPTFQSIPDEQPDDVFERQNHNFFDPNPAHGARIYFLHHILHDWSDEYCVDILTRIRSVMDPRYSRLIINELILPEMGASTRQAVFDMIMMTFNSGLERTKNQWKELLALAGFDIVSFWFGDDGHHNDGIIEAVLSC